MTQQPLPELLPGLSLADQESLDDALEELLAGDESFNHIREALGNSSHWEKRRESYEKVFGQMAQRVSFITEDLGGEYDFWEYDPDKTPSSKKAEEKDWRFHFLSRLKDYGANDGVIKKIEQRLKRLKGSSQKSWEEIPKGQVINLVKNIFESSVQIPTWQIERDEQLRKVRASVWGITMCSSFDINTTLEGLKIKDIQARSIFIEAAVKRNDEEFLEALLSKISGTELEYQTNGILAEILMRKGVFGKDFPWPENYNRTQIIKKVCT